MLVISLQDIGTQLEKFVILWTAAGEEVDECEQYKQYINSHYHLQQVSQNLYRIHFQLLERNH
jgi:hypothetical protein